MWRLTIWFIKSVKSKKELRINNEYSPTKWKIIKLEMQIAKQSTECVTMNESYKTKKNCRIDIPEYEGGT